ncbi:hypothetical protein CEP88_00425 (plasmid) [Roseobacter denitrificans]|uniref:zinc finger domain-containing protein n=1 Tax=Roseobacter denitrificans TaxID=2434 RepID=UPI0005C655ED|nr:hypothetical protein [Roseobacter denitrificans]AVL51256.1 hypothetical protein CEP88_00425 [Roseobacter denitrificans]SFG47342.1 hypothetical protein SAMN05443635_1216 [Roseobacter denitrificans OCh 114]
MIDFTAYRHPVLAVACPECGKRAGAWCIRPSGHTAMDLHRSRKAEADRVFIDQHGPDASIERVQDSWAIDPQGRAHIRPQPEQLALF